MAKPPILKRDYFQIMIDEVKPYYHQIGIDLTFEGYKETVDEYSISKYDDFEQMWKLSRDFHMWGEYFTEIKALTEKYFLDSEIEEKKIFAITSINADITKVSSGDRIANKSIEVINARRNKNLLKSFLTVLDSKIDSAYKVHHHCKATCNWLTINNNSNPNSKIISS